MLDILPKQKVLCPPSCTTF